jgi:hypothetical protein
MMWDDDMEPTVPKAVSMREVRAFDLQMKAVFSIDGRWPMRAVFRMDVQEQRRRPRYTPVRITRGCYGSN